MSELAPGPTVGDLRRRLAARLARAEIDGNPSLDARLLLAFTLGCASGDVVLMETRPVTALEAAEAAALAKRRAAGEPVARILGEKEFWGLSLVVGPQTLIPRPDTETVVEAALRAVDRDRGRDAELAIVDLGTGSGAILLALLSELPRAYGLGIDIASAAALTASGNAARLGLGDRARFVAGNWGDALCGGFDLIVSNPPYVARGDIEGLAVEVRRFDPHIALDGGDDGMDGHRAVLADLDRLMSCGGTGFLEIGMGQDGAVGALASASGFSVDRHRDLGGVVRVLEIRPTADRGGRIREAK